MPLTAWLALTFWAVAIVGGGTIAVIRALRLWRTISRVGGAAGDAVASHEISLQHHTRDVGL